MKTEESSMKAADLRQYPEKEIMVDDAISRFFPKEDIYEKIDHR